MSEERSQFAQRIDERKFTLSRRGYDKREVREYLEDLEQAFREVEGHSKRLSQRVGELERDLDKARATERVSVDNAMMAVFDAKDRILERARRRADEIEEEAHAEASRIKAAAITGAGGGAEAGELAAARAQADEIVASARREADRLRRDVPSEASEDLEAELAAASAQLRRAHADTSSAREELDAARRRIVELESGLDGDSPGDLEGRFAALESHLSSAQSDAERLGNDLQERDAEVAALQVAVAAAEEALEESKSYVSGIEADLEVRSAQVASLESDAGDLRAELERATAAIRPEAEFEARMRADQAALSDSINHQDQEELVRELASVSGTLNADADRVAELEAALGATEQELADSRATIAALEAQTATAEVSESDTEEADSIVAAAREEAEAIAAEAEEEADQRAAKVIAKAREEADQMRQTVATLTAQAEDARSAALRSKIEADDLAEAQRSISGAREDIVATARSRAEEIESDALRAADAIKQQADDALSEALGKADELREESEKKAQAVLDAAEEQANKVMVEAKTAVAEAPDTSESSSGDELAAMLAAAEQEVAISEELRRQREELELREQEIAERERAITAQRAGATQINLPTSFPSDATLPVAADVEDHAIAVDDVSDDGAGDESDPADRLSALLEQAGSPATSEETERDDADRETEDEARPRMAWPTPVRRPGESPVDGADQGGDIDEDTPSEDDGDEEEERESRYRSRSAQLPRLGNQAKSNMTTMANLRKKSRGTNNP